MRRTSATLAACKNDTAEPSRHCDQPIFRPQRVVGRSPTAFFRLGSERSDRDPSRFFPFPLPWTKSMGFIFSSFAEVLVRCLCFPLSTYVIHAVNENHFKLGTWAITNKDQNPPCCPRAANNREGKEKGEKGKNGGCSPPNPQPGCRLVAMGTTARLTPHLTHCSGPWTRSVWRSACWTRRNLGSYKDSKPSLLPACLLIAPAPLG